jgi:hypothetical protein
MKYKKNILICFGIVLLNLLIGMIFPPTGIYLTPIVLLLGSRFLGFGRDMTQTEIDAIPSIKKSLWLFGMVLIHDVGTRCFSGGDPDAAGRGLMFLFLLIGFVPTSIELSRAILRNEQESRAEKLKAIGLFVGLGVSYLGILQVMMPRFY